MKISKDRIKEIIAEEVEKFKNEYASKVIKENLHPGPKDVLKEKWDKDVETKSTGEYSDVNISELKKEVIKLKRQNDKHQEKDKKVPEKNKKKMGQLLFAIRAKQGWKKGEGSTGV